ncbi:MAG: molecular chaperone HtpG, partial [Bacteroidales bacterium]|nr:molecular chaperone HtpG [Bacteroidales bacterium]
LNFYKALYPMEEEPMFWIHLNVDYPFNLTGVLYFPKIKERMAIDKNKIQLYCNQMFVTDHVDNIVPDFLTLLHGVIDSPDIPLNVSRSYLQSDANVKKISTYITKKVADRLESISKEQKEQFEQKWDNIKLFIEYGMLSDEKFCERGLEFALLKNTDGKYFKLEDYRKAIEGEQTDKDKQVVYLYATRPDEQYAFIEAAKNKGYDVLLMDCELDSHFVGLLEQKIKDSRFARVDSDSIGNLIKKEDEIKPEMSDDDKKALDDLFKSVLPEGGDYMVEPRNLGETEAAVLITQNEFMRRYREMSAMGGGMNFYGSLPESYNVIVNMENPAIAKIWGDRENSGELLKQVVDLALLSNGMLKGKALADFIERSRKLLEK